MFNNAERCDTSPDMAASKKPRDAMIGIRVSKADRDAWIAAAERDGRTLTSWITARLNGLPTTAPAHELAIEPAPMRKRKVR
jgi:hypothetical protein